jgi:hypothetical protein
MEGDAAYFARRALQEREAALERRPTARQAHLQLAARYDDLAHSITARDKHVGVDLDAGGA